MANPTGSPVLDHPCGKCGCVDCQCNVKKAEAVDHPSYYGGKDNPFEHVKVAEALGWVDNAFIYNCTKYLWRYRLKSHSTGLEDLQKAKWYLEREIARLENA
jgi:hypothetical protein